MWHLDFTDLCSRGQTFSRGTIHQSVLLVFLQKTEPSLRGKFFVGRGGGNYSKRDRVLFVTQIVKCSVLIGNKNTRLIKYYDQCQTKHNLEEFHAFSDHPVCILRFSCNLQVTDRNDKKQPLNTHSIKKNCNLIFGVYSSFCVNFTFALTLVLDPPIDPGLIEPVSQNLVRILETQP